MRVNKITCHECGKLTNSRYPYCIHCFTPVRQRLPDNTPYGALALIAIIAVLTIAMLVGNVVYAIFK